MGWIQMNSDEFSHHKGVNSKKELKYGIGWISPLGFFSGRLHQVLRLLLTQTITSYFYSNWYFTSLSVFILIHPVNFPVGGNRSARRKPTTFDRVLTDSFHMSRALGSSYVEKVLAENRTCNLRWKRWKTGALNTVPPPRHYRFLVGI